MSITLSGTLDSTIPFKSGRSILFNTVEPSGCYVIVCDSSSNDTAAIKILEMFVNTKESMRLTGTVEKGDYLPFFHVESIGSNEFPG